MSDVIVSAAFLNLGKKGSWTFKNLVNPGEVTLTSMETEEGKLRVALPIVSGPSSHTIAIRLVELPPSTEWEYTLLQSHFWGLTFTWGNGLRIPDVWKVGETVSAASKEINPWSNQPVHLSLTLKSHGKIQPPPGSPFPPGAELQAIELEISAHSGGLFGIQAKVCCALRIGVISMLGSNAGTTFHMSLLKWTNA